MANKRGSHTDCNVTVRIFACRKRKSSCFCTFYFLYFAASSDPPVALPLVDEQLECPFGLTNGLYSDSPTKLISFVGALKY